MGLSRLRSFFAAGVVLICQNVYAQSAGEDAGSVQHVVDSLKIEDNYDQGLGLFMDFCYYIHPFQIDHNQSFAEEISIANAPEDIRNDLLFTPDSSILSLQDYDINYDNIPHVSTDLIADRLSCLKSQIPLVMNEQVRGYVDYFTIRRRDYTLRMLSRKNLYFPMFEQKLAEHGLPTELKYLSIVESALVPTAVSPAGAVGLWQFMPRTGSSFGLKQDRYVDERKDPAKATDAACKYLRSLYEYYNDWELALAAYNCGPGTINRAMKRSGKNTFWGIYNHLPKETRSYVPMFVAVTYAMNYAEDHNIIQNHPYYPIDADTVYVSQYLSLKDLAQKLNVCVSDLEELNPELRQKAVPAYAKNYPLRIPAERMDDFMSNQDNILRPLKRKEHDFEEATASVENRIKPVTLMKANAATKVKTLHTIKRGESLGTISRKYHVSIADLKSWNKIRGSMIHTGSKLVIWKKGAPVQVEETEETEVAKNTKTPEAGKEKTTEKTESKAEEKAVAAAEPAEVKSKTVKKPALSTAKPAAKTTAAATAKGKVHVVKRGDSLWSIANKYGVTVADLKRLNGLRSDKLALDQKIKVK